MPEWDLRVLGPVTVVAADGRAVPVGGRRQRELLALLIGARGRVVSLERLIDALWPDDPPARAAGAVRTFVSDLRRALPAQLLVTEGSGYALRPPDDRVDVRRVERWAAQARELPPEAADRVLGLALAEWRGEACDEFPDAGWARAERARLAELHVRLVEERCRARLDTGRADDALDDLRALVATHPWRAEAWRLLALGLHRDGRSPEALAELTAARTRLVDELGLDPDPRLAELEVAILRGEPLGAQDVWARTTTAYAGAPARSRLETTAALISDLAASGAVATAAEQRLGAVHAAERFGDADLTARVIGRFDVPGVWTRSDDPALAASLVAAAERTLSRLGGDGSPAARARLLATIAMESRGTADRGGQAREAERLARELGDPRLLCFALGGRLMQAFDRAGRAGERHDLAVEIIGTAVAHDLPTFEIHGRICRSQALGALGRFAEADDEAARVDALADRFERPLATVFTTLHRRMRDGGPAPAELLAGSGMAGLSEGLAGLIEAVADRPGPDPGPYSPWVEPWIAARAGDQDRARRLLDVVPEPPRDLLHETLWLLVLKSALSIGHPEAARRAADALRPAATERAAGSGVVDLGPIGPWLTRVT